MTTARGRDRSDDFGERARIRNADGENGIDLFLLHGLAQLIERERYRRDRLPRHIILREDRLDEARLAMLGRQRRVGQDTEAMPLEIADGVQFAAGGRNENHENSCA